MSKNQIIMGICGWKNSGKTTLIRSLIPFFLEKNLTVGVIKKTHHHVVVDDPHTDSMSYKTAGAKTTALWSEQGWRLHGYPDASLGAHHIIQTIMGRMEENILLLEGYKQADIPKIALLADNHDEYDESKRSYLDWPFLVGVIANFKPFYIPPSLSWYKKNDLTCIADLILEKGLRL